MRIVVVSSYPPRHCGIGTYAQAQVERLRAEGHRVTVISPRDGHGDLRVGFFGGRPFRTAASEGRDADRIIVHFQPALYFRPRAPLSKVAASAGLWSLIRRRPQTEILVHEADPPRWWRPDEVLLSRAMRGARQLLFHTDRERRRFAALYHPRAAGRVIRHGDSVALRARMTRGEARRRLGLPDERILVIPGFLHPGKGADRAIAVFEGPGRLIVIGSVKDPTPENLAHLASLRSMVEGRPGVQLLERFLDDEAFDAWLSAADALVLPYRHSWSSGVLARAQAVGTPAVVSDVGGLPEQAAPGDVVFRSDEELRDVLRRIGLEARR